jgi:hypothetical protein
MRRNFKWHVGDRDKKKELYRDNPPGEADPLKFAYLISTKNNVFTVTNTLGMLTVS